MSKGGSAPSTAGLEQATADATALQKLMYEQGREDLQPWYKTGSAGMGKLADLLGLSGGSVQGRDDIYSELLPQYTTQQPQAGGGQWLGMGGQLYGDESLADRSFLDPSDESGQRLSYIDLNEQGERQDYRYAREYMPTTSDATDYAGLNAAVDARLGSQGTPEGYGSLLTPFGMDQFQEDPGAQFRQEQGQKALERSMAAQGITLGGGGFGQINPQAATALQDYSQGLASQEYGAAYNRYGQDQANVYNRLMGVAGMGQGAASQQVQAGQQYGVNVGNLGTGLAQAQYQGAQAQAAQPGMFDTLLQTAATAAPYIAMFSDERLKENIELVGHEMGYNIYEFDYRDGSGRYRGVMAQNVLEIEPEAVVEHSNGFLMVNYDKLGLKMERVNGV